MITAVIKSFAKHIRHLIGHPDPAFPDLMKIEFFFNSKVETHGCFVAIGEKATVFSKTLLLNSWITGDINFLACGTFDTWYLFDKRTLLKLANTLPLKWNFAGLSLGIQITKQDADKYCVLKVKKDKSSKVLNLRHYHSIIDLARRIKSSNKLEVTFEQRTSTHSST